MTKLRELRFNILLDAWIPLLLNGKCCLASYVDLMTGKRDAEELLHPRDDLRFYALMLLSSVTQALFAPNDAKELEKRLVKPLPRAQVMRRVQEVKADFELLGPGAFLQDDHASEEVTTAELFLDLPKGTKHTLFRPPYPYDGLCPSCALLALYGAQAFAPEGGRGKSPGVRGGPPLTTLVAEAGVRSTVWANVLSRSEIGHGLLAYPSDPKRPWRVSRAEKSGEQIGLIEGLFWQPRSVALRPTDSGHCSACGAAGPRLEARGFGKKSRVSGGFFAHPYTPSQHVRRPAKPFYWRSRKLEGERPAWTGLADMFSVVANESRNKVFNHAAPVVTQWVERLGRRELRLLTFCYRANKTKVLGRFNESFSLSFQLCGAGDLISNVRYCVELAENALQALQSGLRRAHSTNPKDKGGFWMADATSSFWNETESSFWTTFVKLQKAKIDPTPKFAKQVKKVACDLFDRHTEGSLAATSKTHLIARERQKLSNQIKVPNQPKETE